MSDVEVSGTTQGTEGSTGSAEAGQTAGAGVGATQEAVGGSQPQGIAEKIAKHKGSEIGSSAQVGSKAQAASAVSPEVNTPGLQAAQNPAYAANYKFKFLGEEKEIPEMYRQLIKDAETEKQIRELHEQAMWFQETKPRFVEQSKQLGGLTKGLEVLDKHLANKDYGKFFGAFGLTDDQIFEYAKNRLEYHQMPDDQRQRMDAENELKERAFQLEQQNVTLQQQFEQAATQQKDVQLRGIMGHPTIAPIAGAHPGGQQGFYRDVAQHAWFHQQTTGQDLTPEQAVMSYIQQRGLSASPVANATHQAGMTTQHQPVMQSQRAPTLPTIPSQGTSPAKKVVSSMKDLRAAKARAEAQHSG